MTPVPVAARRRRLAVLVAVIGTGALLRVLLLAALPDFFGPGDPATYFAMAQGILREGVPRLDFIWNYADAPATIRHVETYYEPAFAYLLAGPMALLGASPWVGRALALACGVLAPLLTFVFARRFGGRVALVAAALVALEPWSIYYSGVLMKETLVSVIVILAIESLRRLLSGGRGPLPTGFLASAVVLGSSAFQYELLPILAVSAAISIAMLRRDALLPYLAATAGVMAAAFAATSAGMSVPISGKFAFFAGTRLWTPEARAGATELGWSVARLLPIGYVLGALILKWCFPIPALAWIGAGARGLPRVEIVLPSAFLACFLYFHGVPHDLWQRDFVPLLPVVAPLVALAACRREAWTAPLVAGRRGLAAMPRGALALGFIAGAVAGVYYAIHLHIRGVFPARWMPWTVIGSTVLFGIAFTLVFRRLSPVVRKLTMPRALTAACLVMVLLAYSQTLPWSWIYANPQFPGYERERALREHACELLSTVPRAPVMTSDPAEVHLYSGNPAVRLPITHDVGAIEMVRHRYGVRYLLARRDEIGPATAARLALAPRARRFGHVLYEFPPPRGAGL